MKQKFEILLKVTIDQDENLGEQVLRSGHLEFKSYKIDHISTHKKIHPGTEEICRITYRYTLYIETEFTYLNNPSNEHKFRRSIFLDNKGNIVKESPKEAL